MTDFDAMSIAELEEYREALWGQITELRASFTAAGLALEQKIAQTPEAVAMAKLNEARAEMAALRAQSEI